MHVVCGVEAAKDCASRFVARSQAPGPDLVCVVWAIFDSRRPGVIAQILSYHSALANDMCEGDMQKESVSNHVTLHPASRRSQSTRLSGPQSSSFLLALSLPQCYSSSRQAQGKGLNKTLMTSMQNVYARQKRSFKKNLGFPFCINYSQIIGRKARAQMLLNHELETLWTMAQRVSPRTPVYKPDHTVSEKEQELSSLHAQLGNIMSAKELSTTYMPWMHH